MFCSNTKGVSPLLSGRSQRQECSESKKKERFTPLLPARLIPNSFFGSLLLFSLFLLLVAQIFLRKLAKKVTFFVSLLEKNQRKRLVLRSFESKTSFSHRFFKTRKHTTIGIFQGTPKGLRGSFRRASSGLARPRTGRRKDNFPIAASAGNHKPCLDVRAYASGPTTNLFGSRGPRAASCGWQARSASNIHQKPRSLPFESEQTVVRTSFRKAKNCFFSRLDRPLFAFSTNSTPLGSRSLFPTPGG